MPSSRQKQPTGLTGAAACTGVPFAVKDIFETAGMPTSFGSPIYEGFRPPVDAGCVAIASEQGAIALGKVATGEFATQTPSRARNPLNLEHTPGGSSSGSAAAVADCMVPAAFSTQTTGSIVRPAVYCGVVGYKPTYDFMPRAGMKTLSPSQDTVGLITRDVRDAAFVAYGMHGCEVPDITVRQPRIAICTSSQWAHATSKTVAAIEQFAGELGRHGAVISRRPLPAFLESMIDLQARIFAFEARKSLAFERLGFAERLSPRLRARLEGGADIAVEEYLEMRRATEKARQDANALFEGVDALIYPAAEGEAEHGHDFAGSPRFGALWTLLHLPCISFPIDKGPSGLPLGVQLIGRFAMDGMLLAIARQAQDVARDGANQGANGNCGRI